MNQQENGNSQLNSIRNDFNNRVDKKMILGNSKRISWNKTRRHRTI